MFCAHRSFPIDAGKDAQHRAQLHRSTSRCRRVNKLMHPWGRPDRLVQPLQPHDQAPHIHRHRGLQHRELDACGCRKSMGGVQLALHQRSSKHLCPRWCWHSLQPTIVHHLLIRSSIVHVRRVGRHRLRHSVQQKIRGLMPLECHP